MVIIFVLTNLWWLSLLLAFRQEGEAILKTIPLSSWAIDSSRNANILNLLANTGQLVAVQVNGVHRTSSP